MFLIRKGERIMYKEAKLDLDVDNAVKKKQERQSKTEEFKAKPKKR